MVEEYEERNKRLSCAPANEERQIEIFKTLEKLEHFEAKPGQADSEVKFEIMRMRKNLSLPALAQFKLLREQMLCKRRHLVSTEQKQRNDFDLNFYRSEKLPPIHVAPEPKPTESGVWSRYGIKIHEKKGEDNKKMVETKKPPQTLQKSGENRSNTQNT